MNYIYCLNNISSKGTDLLSSSYELSEDPDQAAGILVRSAAMHDMEFSDTLLAIGRAGAGVNNIPLDRCVEEGIVVFNAPGANANAVKEIVIAGLLLGSRGIVDGITWCRDNEDDENIKKATEKQKKAYAGCEIMGKTLGIIGLGAIGAKVAVAADALGMNIVGYDPFVNEEAAKGILAAMDYTADLNALYAASDYITIHVPAMDGTIGMIDDAACAAMKDGAVFLNFARDTLVDSAAMSAALESGKLHAYITDFPTAEVMKIKGAIVIPHLGASTAEAEENCAIMATEELMNYIDNGNIVHSVNYPALDMGPANGKQRVAVLYKNADGAADAVAAALGNPTTIESANRGDAAYTLAEVEGDVDTAAVEAAATVYRVRIIK